MLIEAIRAHLVGGGIPEASYWSTAQVATHMDKLLMDPARDSTAMIQDVAENVKTIKDVLSLDLH